MSTRDRHPPSPRRKQLPRSGNLPKQAIDHDKRKSIVEELQTELKSTSHLNIQLQHDYDGVLQRLAQAELTIDQLRFGVQTEVNKTVYFTVKEDGRSNSKPGFRPSSRSRSPYRSMGTGAMEIEAGVQADHFRERESEDDDGDLSSRGEVTMSSTTQGQRATLESTQMGLVFQTRALQDQLQNLQEMLQETGPRRSEIVRDLDRIAGEVKGLEHDVIKARTIQERLSHTKGVGEPANVDHLQDELEHLTLMLAETQDALKAQLEWRERMPVADGQDMAVNHYEGPTLADLIEKLSELEEKHQVDPSPGMAAEIRQLKEVMEQLQFQLDEQRISQETPSRMLTISPSLASSCSQAVDSSQRRQQQHPSDFTETGVQASQCLPGEYLSSLVGPVGSCETEVQTMPPARRSSESDQSRIPLPKNKKKTFTSSSSISSSSSSSKPNKKHSRRPLRPSKSSEISTQQREDSQPRQNGSLAPENNEQFPPHHSPPVDIDSKGTQASLNGVGPSRSRLPRPVARKKQMLGDSFDRDSGYPGSFVPPHFNGGSRGGPRSSSNGRTSSPSSIEAEIKEEQDSPHQSHRQPSYYFPYSGVQPDTSAVDSLREEVQRLRDQLNGINAANQAIPKEEPRQMEPAPVTSFGTQTAEQPHHIPRTHFPHPVPYPLEPHSGAVSQSEGSMSEPRQNGRQPRQKSRQKSPLVERIQREDPRRKAWRPDANRRHNLLTSESGSDLNQKNTRVSTPQRSRRKTSPPRKISSQSTQTPPKWSSSSQGVGRPRDVGSDFASASSIAGDTSSSETIPVENESFECPLCSGSGTFMSASGQRRHRHGQLKKKSRGCQTPGSHIRDAEADRGRARAVHHTRKAKPRHPIKIYVDEDEDEDEDDREEQPEIGVGDEVDDPSSIRVLRRKPKSASTPFVYTDPSESDDEVEPEPIIVRRRLRRERSPTVIFVEKESDPEPSVYVYRRSPSRSRSRSYRVDDRPKRRRSKSAYEKPVEKPRGRRYVVEEDEVVPVPVRRRSRRRSPRVSYMLEEDDNDDSGSPDSIHWLYKRRRSQMRSVPRPRHLNSMTTRNDYLVDDLEMALSRVKRETRRAANQSKDMVNNMTFELSRTGVS
eukprot:m.49405 g.49405  ORF g.49405 m.49405 type:complete len:1109 (+) comp33980_c0_seq3:57-3383(+)